MQAEESRAAKRVTGALWEALLRGDRAAAAALADPGLRLRAFEPVNEVRGLERITSEVMAPLRRAGADMLRRPYICIAGEHAGATWVATTGDLIGSFAGDWLGIPAGGRSARIRFGEFCRVEDGRAQEIFLLLDLVCLQRQCGRTALPPETGDTRWIPGPLAGDGLGQTGADAAESARSLALVLAMNDGLNEYDGARLGSMGMTRFWSEDMRWYGPAGIGSTYGLAGFEQHHQIPFLRAFPDRVGGTEDTVWIAEGNYVACAGFPALHMTHAGEYLGQAATGRRASMRGIDWWKREDARLVENWVFVDLPHFFRQVGVNLLPGGAG